MPAAHFKHFTPILFFAAVLAAQHVPDLKATASWLDKNDLSKNWNRPGRPIPHAPRGAELDDFCRAKRYHAQTPEESFIEKAGWILMGKSTAVNGISIVGAQAFNDGMCRPTQYQEFVFVRGQYAGTLSPALMDAREDGAFSRIASLDGGHIAAEFVRYTEKDPRCCPSRISQVEYEIRGESGKPLVAVKSVKTGSAE